MVYAGRTKPLQDERRADGFDDAQEEAAQRRAGDGANAAQYGGGERLDARYKAHREDDLLEHQPPQHGGNAGHSRADGEGGGDGPVNVDAHQRRHVLVFGHGADRLAGFGLLDEEIEGDEGHDRDDDDDEAHLQEVEAQNVDSTFQNGRHGKRLDRRTEQAAEDVLPEEGRANGRDERHKARRAAQRSVGDPLRQQRDSHGG